MAPLSVVTACLLGGLAALWCGAAFLLIGPRVRYVQTAVEAIGWRGAVALITALLTLCLLSIVALSRMLRLARHQAADAMAMRDFLSAALRSFPVGVQIKDTQGRYVWINEFHERALSQPAADLLGRTVAELGLPKTLVEQVLAEDRRVLETGTPHGPVEQVVPGPKGAGSVTLPVIKAPLFQHGQLTHIVTFAGEMPSWRDKQLQLEEARRLLQTVMDAAPITIQVVDRDMRLRWANRAFVEMFGLQGTSPIGMSLNDAALSPALLADIMAFNQDLLSGRRDVVRTEQHYAATDRSPEWHLLVIKVPVRGDTGEVEQILTIGTDVSALKRAAAEAEAATALLESILQNVSLTIQVKDRDLRYRWVNRAFSEAMKLDAGAIVGRSVDDMPFLQETRARFTELDQRVLATGETIRFDDHWRNDTAEQLMRVIKAPIMNTAGQVTHVLTIGDDVTEEHRLRQQADTANRLIEGLLQNVPLGIQVKDRDLRYRWANRTFADAVRMTPEDLLGKTVHDLGVPDGAARHTEEQDRAVLTTGKTISFTERWVDLAGYRQMMIIKAPMLDADGRVSHVITIGADISELHRLRAEADDVRRQLQQVVDAIPVTIALKDRDRRYRWVNREFQRILGNIVSSKAIGARVEDLVPDKALADEVKRSDERLLATGEEAPHIAQRLPVSDTEMRDYDVRRVAVRDANGAIEGILIVGVDVTELLRISDELRLVNADLEQRAQERARELAKVNELVSAVLESAPVPIMTMRLDGRFTSWNPAAEKLFGFTAAEALGDDLPPRSLERRADFAFIRDRILRGESFAGMETTRTTRGGASVELLMSGGPLHNADGAIEGIVVICLDITEQRAITRQLQQAQKMEAVGQLTGGIAHDFNNLLAVVIGALDELDAELPADSAQRPLVQQAIEAAESGADLTSRLLAFSRRQALRSAPTDVHQLVGEMTPLLQRVLGAAIAIRHTADPVLWPALVDESQLESAILNLAVNARDAMPSGGTLTIDIRNALIGETEARTQPELAAGAYVCVTVSDTGSGMPPDILGRVFEPFFTTKEVGKGSGLGLSMVLGFVKQSGGHVRLTSTQGEGTSVALYLPHAPATPPSDG